MSKKPGILLHSVSKYACELILAICLFASFYHNSKNNTNEGIIRSDGVGYYAYLPAIFIYNDYQYTFIDSVQKHHKEITISRDFLSKTDKGDINKYYVGEAMLQTPFFLIAHFLSLLSGLPADGFSLLYQLSVLVAANFFLWTGCRFTRKLLLEYGIPSETIAFILCLTVFGSNLFFYATVEFSYSHIYSYGIVSAFLFYSYSFVKYRRPGHLYLAAFLYAMVLLLRPTNAFVLLLVPFFAGSLKNLAEVIKAISLRSWIISAAIGAFMIFLQLLLYYLQTGHFFIWSYGTERFYFDDPQFFNILCEYRKGLFVYAPLTLLSLGGLIYVFRQNKFQFFVLLVFIFLFTYVAASWWCWWYGGSLGQREFVDIYCIVSLLLAFLYLSIRSKAGRIVYYMSSLLFIYWSLTLTYQYRHQIIDCYNMNSKKFWFTFLKTSPDIEGLVYAHKFFVDGEPTNLVWLKASSSNKYVSSDKNPESSVCVCRDKAMMWETFNLVPLEGNKVAIKADDGTYFSARLNEQNRISHIAPELKEWERFELVWVKEGVAALKACNNKFVLLRGEELFADANSAESAEKFLIIKK